MANKNISIAELKEYSDVHISYELTQLWFNIAMLGKTGYFLGSKNSVLLQLLHNTLLDSFAIHARNLRDFFYRPPKVDDIAASHYVDNWEQVRPKESQVLKKIPTKANKQVAHLTFKRMNYEKDFDRKGWNWTSIYSEVVDLFLLFVEEADEEKLGPEFVATLDFQKQKIINFFQIYGIKEWEIGIRKDPRIKTSD